MISILTALLWDQAAARAGILALLSIGGAYLAQPTGRSWQERLVTAAVVGGGVGAASAPSSRSKELEAELAELRGRLDVISGPKS